MARQEKTSLLSAFKQRRQRKNIKKLIIRGHLIRTARTASFANQNEYKETKKKLRKPEIIGVGISLNWRGNKADNRREKKV